MRVLGTAPRTPGLLRGKGLRFRRPLVNGFCCEAGVLIPTPCSCDRQPEPACFVVYACCRSVDRSRWRLLLFLTMQFLVVLTAFMEVRLLFCRKPLLIYLTNPPPPRPPVLVLVFPGVCFFFYRFLQHFVPCFLVFQRFSSLAQEFMIFYTCLSTRGRDLI